MSKQIVKVGLIGVGGFGKLHQKFVEYDGFGGQIGQLVAICDCDLRRCGEVGDELGIDRRFVDHRELLGCSDIGAIIVATPATVREPVLDALKAGKHVFVEKPVAKSMAFAQKIREESHKQGKLCTTHYQWGLCSSVARMHEAVVSGQLGDIRQIRLEAKRRPACVELEEIAQHLLDVAMQFTGPIKSCVASILRNGKPIERSDIVDIQTYCSDARPLGFGAGDTMHITYTTDSGIPIYLELLPDVYDVQKPSVQIVGTKGRIEARGGLLEYLRVSDSGGDTISSCRASGGGWREFKLRLWAIENGQEYDAMADPKLNPSYLLMNRFLKVIQDGGDNPYPLDRARQVLEAIQLPYLSASQRSQRVYPPLTGEHPVEIWRTQSDYMTGGM